MTNERNFITFSTTPIVTAIHEFLFSTADLCLSIHNLMQYTTAVTALSPNK